MVLIATSIEIRASPERVHEIVSADSADTSTNTTETNDLLVHGLCKILRMVSATHQVYRAAREQDDYRTRRQAQSHLEGTSFSPIVLENTETSFKWLGSLPYIFSGAHSFLFQPSEKTPGHTTFVDNEDFSGLLSVLMLPSLMGGGTKANFEKFNEDLKKRVETLESSR